MSTYRAPPRGLQHLGVIVVQTHRVFDGSPEKEGDLINVGDSVAIRQEPRWLMTPDRLESAVTLSVRVLGVGDKAIHGMSKGRCELACGKLLECSEKRGRCRRGVLLDPGALQGGENHASHVPDICLCCFRQGTAQTVAVGVSLELFGVECTNAAEYHAGAFESEHRLRPVDIQGFVVDGAAAEKKAEVLGTMQDGASIVLGRRGGVGILGNGS